MVVKTGNFSWILHEKTFFIKKYVLGQTEYTHIRYELYKRRFVSLLNFKFVYCVVVKKNCRYK